MKRHNILSILCAAVILTGCQQISEEYVPAEAIITSAETTAAETTAATTEITTETEPVITEKTVSFTALGDNLIHSSIYKQAARRGAESGKDYDLNTHMQGPPICLTRRT